LLLYVLVGTVARVHEDSAERLIESARELLWERGYVGTSPRAIQQRAGAGQGSMYHHFSGKQDLAATALRRSAEQLRGEVGAILDGPGSAIERIAACLLRERDVLRGCRIGGMTHDPDVVADPVLREPVRAALSWLRQRAAQLLRESQDTGELPADLDADDVAAMLGAVVQGGYVLARAENSPEPYERAVRAALALLTTAAARSRPAA
jgi:TetR/AcrR family transcriptional regulator, transcriptional repressor for nem operon